MTNKKYLRFRYYDIISTFLGCTIWFSLSSYVVIAKSKLGIDLINILEAVSMMVTLVGIKYGFELVGKLTLSKIVLVDIIIETLFIMLFVYLVIIDSDKVGLSIYLIIMLGRFINPFKKEKERYVEDHNLTNVRYKLRLSDIRKKSSYVETIGGVIGISFTLVFINVLNVDIKTFVLSLMCLSILQNTYDYLKWIKYLK